MSFGRFLKTLDPNLYDQYRLERYKEGDNGHANYKKPTEKYKQDSNVTAEKLDNNRRIYDSLLDRLDTLPDDHIAVKYVQNRLIPRNKWHLLYYIDDIKKMNNLSEKTKDKFFTHEDRLIIPYEDRKGHLTGFVGRALRESEHQSRYISGTISDHGPKIFGLYEADLTKPIIVVEGQFDSLFLPNCVAVGGTDLKQIERFLPKHLCTLVFDYQPRNTQLCKIIKQAIDLGYKVSLLPDNFPGKDINDAVLQGLTSEEIYSIIRSNECSGATAYANFIQWKKV
jgi:hypothetical protein